MKILRYTIQLDYPKEWGDPLRVLPNYGTMKFAVWNRWDELLEERKLREFVNDITETEHIDKVVFEVADLNLVPVVEKFLHQAYQEVTNGTCLPFVVHE